MALVDNGFVSRWQDHVVVKVTVLFSPPPRFAPAVAITIPASHRLLDQDCVQTLAEQILTALF